MPPQDSQCTQRFKSPALVAFKKKIKAFSFWTIWKLQCLSKTFSKSFKKVFTSSVAKFAINSKIVCKNY